jgi:hypothetical protein
VLDFVAAKSLETPVEERLTLLRRVFGSTHPLRFPAGRHLEYTLKNQHRWDEALAVFDELARPRPTSLHLGQRAQVLSMSRQFVSARAAAAGLPAAAQIRRVASRRYTPRSRP